MPESKRFPAYSEQHPMNKLTPTGINADAVTLLSLTWRAQLEHAGTSTRSFGEKDMVGFVAEYSLNVKVEDSEL